jgi:hypothetical protein
MMSKEIIAVYCENHKNTEIRCVDRLQRFLMLKQVADTVSILLKGFTLHQ